MPNTQYGQTAWACLIQCRKYNSTGFFLQKLFPQLLQLIFNRTTRKLNWVHNNRICLGWGSTSPNFIYQVSSRLDQFLLLLSKSTLPLMCSINRYAPRINTNSSISWQILVQHIKVQLFGSMRMINKQKRSRKCNKVSVT